MKWKIVLPALVFIAVAATAFKITDDIIHRLGMENGIVVNVTGRDTPIFTYGTEK